MYKNVHVQRVQRVQKRTKRTKKSAKKCRDERRNELAGQVEEEQNPEGDPKTQGRGESERGQFEE